jgi:hypothetical protein
VTVPISDACSWLAGSPVVLEGLLGLTLRPIKLGPFDILDGYMEVPAGPFLVERHDIGFSSSQPLSDAVGGQALGGLLVALGPLFQGAAFTF